MSDNDKLLLERDLGDMFHKCRCSECVEDRERVIAVLHALQEDVTKWMERAGYPPPR